MDEYGCDLKRKFKQVNDLRGRGLRFLFVPLRALRGGGGGRLHANPFVFEINIKMDALTAIQGDGEGA